MSATLYRVGSMIEKQTTKIVSFVFLLLYLPFIYDYGFEYASIPHPDLQSFYRAASLAFKFQSSPYKGKTRPRKVSTRIPMEETKKRGREKEPSPYLYPPPSLLLFFPFSLASYNTIKQIVLFTNHACLLFLMYLLLFKIFDLRNLTGAAYAAVLLLLIVYTFKFTPIISTLNQGQINLYIITLICLSWYGMKKNFSPILVALPLALSIIWKAYPLLLLAILFINRNYRATFWVMVLVILFSVVSYLVLPRSVWSDWYSNVLPTGGYAEIPKGLFSPAAAWNQSINGFSSRLFQESEESVPLLPNIFLARFVPYVMSILISLYTLLLLYRLASVKKNNLLDFQFASLLIVMYLVAPFSWEHHLVFILPSIILGMLYCILAEESLFLRLLVAFSTLLLAWPIAFYDPVLKTGYLTLLISTKFYAVILLWIFFVYKIKHFLRVGGQEQTGASVAPFWLKAVEN
jgi:Glycosyltransferase family 87